MRIDYRLVAAVGLVMLTACSPAGESESAGSGDSTTAGAAAPAAIEKVATIEPVPPLERISRFDAERELSPGAGCELLRDGAPIMIAVAGDAIAKPGDKLVHLRRNGTDVASLGRGGRFEDGELSITVTIDPAGTPAEPQGETQGRPAQVTVTQATASEDFDAQWTCGA